MPDREIDHYACYGPTVTDLVLRFQPMTHSEIQERLDAVQRRWDRLGANVAVYNETDHVHVDAVDEI